MNTPGIAIFPSVLACEGRVQFRSGLSALYLGLPLVWILAARLSPPEARSLIVLIGLFTDPVMMGGVFSGGFLARERDQGLFGAWAVTPMGPGTWLAGRITMIALQGTLGGVILVLGSGVGADWAILPWAVFFASASGAMVGLITARPFRDILSYFVVGGIASSLVSLPVAGAYLAPSPLWLAAGPVWPGWAAAAAALEVGSGSKAAAVSPPGAALAASAVWCALLFVLTRLVYRRAFFKRRGAGSLPGTFGSILQSSQRSSLRTRQSVHGRRIKKAKRAVKNPVLSLAKTFYRSALRQPIYILLLVIPPLMGLLIRPLPLLFTRFLPAFDYAAWKPLFLAVIAGFPPYMFGILGALQLLDERDLGLLPVFRVTPMTKIAILAAKALPAALMAALGTATALPLSGWTDSISPLALIAACLFAAPSAMFYTLIVAGLSQNKVQGLTASKILGTVLAAPVLWVLLPAPWRWAALIFPSSWPGAVMTAPGTGTGAVWALAGLIYVSSLAVMGRLPALRNYFTV